mmetsp:Transcript_991/g.2491  ORF Transcript_991/g.2491 Transcript_991/m.2491 type:complete len:357 (-) Transcript_991:188-1258(-)|eukprot:CAMPEP_0170619108 /NCGR_PEP_ID=MMETSP0224-20130122/27339_1 /TAXON_ID=285029 /ORGANISM="Togula jolla, Strain CCCM 725" /LENGTH=356 /DNA_ID=CAMNT_0010945173 /DNA_START=76 /DNA_END=1146 /DNA_ORIENTATION=+
MSLTFLAVALWGCSALAFPIPVDQAADPGQSLSFLQTHAGVGKQARQDPGTLGSLAERTGTNISMAQGAQWRQMGGLTVYVMFDKSGSSTTREALVARSTSENWKTGTTPDGDSLGCPSSRQRKGYAGCDYEPCHTLEGPPRCNYQPPGAVIQARDYGYCDQMHAMATDNISTRPCRYFTIMREPISRLVSEYNYFCLACKEFDRFCQHQRGGGGRQMTNICPNISIVEWARRTANTYTRTFSPGHWSSFAEYRYKNLQYFSDGGYLWNVTDEDYNSALAKLKADNMLTILLERLDSSMDRLGAWIGDTSAFQMPAEPANTHKHSYVPTKDERKQLHRLLKYDIALYEALKDGVAA